MARGHPVVSAPLVEGTVLSPWSSLGTLVENQLAADVQLSFCILSSIPLVCVPVLMPAPCCVDCYSSMGDFGRSVSIF